MAESREAVSGFDMRGFIENSLLEWEGMVAAVAVAGGCNLRCPFCHSWRYVVGLADLAPVDAGELFRLLSRQSGWIDGVVLTGGEPTLQPGLADIVRRIREQGVKVKIHSNGTRPDALRELLDGNLLDCLALDYKAPLDERLYPAIGIAPDPAILRAVRESFRLAASSGVDREYHTTLCPAFIDADAFKAMTEWLEPEGLWILQQYESGDCLDPAASGGARYDGARLDAFAAEAGRRHPGVMLRKGRSG